MKPERTANSAKLRCPVCGEYVSQVVDSRAVGTATQPVIRRRRRCLSCQTRYTTIERVVVNSHTAP